MKYHHQDDVIGFCPDYQHPYGCIDATDVTPELGRKIAAFTNKSGDSIAWVDPDDVPIYPQWRISGPGSFDIGE